MIAPAPTIATTVEKTVDELTPEQLRTEIQASLVDARVTAAWLVFDPRRGTGYFTPVARRRADESIRRERRSQVRVDASVGGLNASPEANSAGLNTGPTPAPGNLQVLSADAQLLFAVRTNLRLIVTHLERAAGLCIVKPVPDENASLAEQTEHLDQLLGYVDDRRILARVATELAAAVTTAGEVAYGESMTEIREPCVHCGRNTLVMFWARPHNDIDVDTARCDRDPRTGHYEPCTCAAPLCECKRRPRSYRHEWRRVPGTGPHTIHFLNNRLAQIRGLKKEGSPTMSDAPPLERSADGTDHYLTTETSISGKVTAKLVDADELYRIWMRPDATGMTDDHQAGFRLVHLGDGRVFATELTEIEAAGGNVGRDLVHNHLVPGIRPEGECPACDQTRRDIAASSRADETNGDADVQP